MMNGAVPAALKRGGIYRMTFYPGDRITPKNPGDTSREKYFVIVGLSGDRVLAASLIINSQINQRRFMRIGSYQHRILSSDYSFMTKTYRAMKWTPSDKTKYTYGKDDYNLSD